MSQLTSRPLAIPENSVQGSGNYTVPVNKYAFIHMNTSIIGLGWIGRSSGDYDNTASSDINQTSWDASRSSTSGNNNHSQWLVAGDAVSSSVNAPANQVNNVNTDHMVYSNYDNGFAVIRINGTDVCIARACASANSNNLTLAQAWTGTKFTAQAGWSVSEFPIPKRNLLPSLIEGN